MKKISMKQEIDDKMQSVRVSDDLRQRILDGMAQESERSVPTARHWNRRKLIILAAAAVLVAAFPLTAGAREAYRAISAWVSSSLNGQAAQSAYAVDGAAVDQGIRVAVDSAVNDGHSALVFITVQDTEGKGRLAEDLDLCDTFGLNFGGWHSMEVGNAEFDGYDPDTQTARFRTYTAVNSDIADQPAAVKLTHLMAHKTYYPTTDTGVDLAAIAQRQPKVGGRAIKEIYGSSYINTDEPKMPKASDILTPDVMDVPLGGELGFVHITNVGYIDGRLHIQTRWDESFDNHGDLCLCSASVTDYSAENLADYFAPVSGITSIGFATAEDLKGLGTMYRSKHVEYLFDVNFDDLKNYKLLACDFVKDGEMIEGNWEISFTTHHTESLHLSGGKSAKSVEITPLGVYVEHYTGKDTPEVTIRYRDGSSETIDAFTMTVKRLFSRGSSYYADSLREKPLEEIVSVKLNGVALVTDSGNA